MNDAHSAVYRGGSRAWRQLGPLSRNSRTETDGEYQSVRNQIIVRKGTLSPGSGAGKKMKKMGDTSILGIIAEKSLFVNSSINFVRLRIVYRMATAISQGIVAYCDAH